VKERGRREEGDGFRPLDHLRRRKRGGKEGGEREEGKEGGKRRGRKEERGRRGKGMEKKERKGERKGEGRRRGKMAPWSSFDLANGAACWDLLKSECEREEILHGRRSRIGK